jgi:Leucine-rich repeat (LRR) protein
MPKRAIMANKSFYTFVVLVCLCIALFVFGIVEPKQVQQNQLPKQTSLTKAASPFEVVQSQKKTAIKQQQENQATANNVVDKTPKVNIGSDITMDERQVISIESYGLAFDHSQLTYQWLTPADYYRRIRDTPINDNFYWHHAARLLDTTKPTVTFHAPAVDYPTELHLYLVITDQYGHWAMDTLTLNINPIEIASLSFHELDIPDNGLKQCIEKHTSTQDLSFAGEMKSLNCKSYKIRKLEGIEYLTNLQELNLVDNIIVDIDELSELKKLHTLNLNGNQIYDLRPLSVLSSLILLSLNNNKIEDVTPLSKINNLYSLSLNHNKLTDIRPLSAMHSLIELSLANNPLQQLHSLNKLVQLKTLDVSYTQLATLGPLTRMRRLTYLDVSETNNLRCMHLDWLERLPRTTVKRKGECRL